jgi:putative thioredoxin
VGVIYDVDESGFEQQVLQRSHEVPVVVDFWAEWCAPCRQLSPALEKAAAARDGEVDLAKVDVDSNQMLARAYRVQGIPAVKAFRDGGVVDEFTGALPPPRVEAFFDGLVPSETERLATAAIDSGDEGALRAALEADPRNAAVATALARMLLSRGEVAEALAVLQPFEHDFLAAGLAARARLEGSDEAAELDLGPAFEAWDRGDRETALEHLQRALLDADPEARDLVRRVMVGIFTELGPDHPLAREHRRKMSTVLF